MRIIDALLQKLIVKISEGNFLLCAKICIGVSYTAELNDWD